MQKSKIIKSRDNWKLKSTKHLSEIKNKDKIIIRLKKKCELLEMQLNCKDNVTAFVVSAPISKIVPIVEIKKSDKQCLYVLLVLQTVISFRSAPKVMRYFNSNFPLKLGSIPHFTSLINWAYRAGFGLLKQVKKSTAPWLAIADHSISFGTKKVFVVLRVPLNVIAEKGRALTLSDCELIGLEICEKVNGESIAADFAKIFEKAGIPVGMIKDRDATLQKGFRLYLENEKINIPVIDDIGHVIGTSLKAQFEKCRRFKIFTAMTTYAANKLRQTCLAFLTPPKIRTKGRFQSISRLGKWGQNMLDTLSVSGVASKGSQLEKLRIAIPNFMSIRTFVESFAQTTCVCAKIMEILKNQGLCIKTYINCVELLNTLPNRSIVKVTIKSWLDRNLQIQKDIGCQILIVSSDILESLFGNYKSINERNPQSEINRSVLLLPLLCGNMNEFSFNCALNSTSQKELNEWEKKKFPDTMRKKRRAFFDGIGSQKEGHRIGA